MKQPTPGAPTAMRTFPKSSRRFSRKRSYLQARSHAGSHAGSHNGSHSSRIRSHTGAQRSYLQARSHAGSHTGSHNGSHSSHICSHIRSHWLSHWLLQAARHVASAPAEETKPLHAAPTGNYQRFENFSRELEFPAGCVAAECAC